MESADLACNLQTRTLSVQEMAVCITPIIVPHVECQLELIIVIPVLGPESLTVKLLAE